MAEAEKKPAGAKGSPAPNSPVTQGDLTATAALAGLFVITIVLAVLLAGPALASGLRQDLGFEDPDDPRNVAVYIGLILVFTFVLLYLAKKGVKWVIRLVILGAVGSSMFFVAFPFLLQTVGMGANPAFLVSAVVGLGTALALYLHPEWYVIDIAGVLVAAGAASIFGISFGLLPVILLLVALAIYDAIAVYKTRHMLALADSVIELRLPILLVIPKKKGYHFKDEATKFKEAKAETKGEREAMFMGLGDLVMPTILVISALTFLPLGAGANEVPLAIEWGNVHQEGDVPVDVEVKQLAAHDGQPRLRFDFFAADGRGGAGWQWTADWDADEDIDVTGNGVPNFFEGTYTTTGSYLVHINVTDPEGNTGEALVSVAVNGPWYTPLVVLVKHPAALGAALGTLAGYAVLMRFVLKGNPQAGLPLLNGGSVVGFLVGLYVQTGSIRFW